MLEIRQGNKAFGEKVILHDLSLALPQGQVTCVLGPSGGGKTTLLRVLAGLLPLDRGEVIRPDLRASYVFQEDRLLLWSTALENLLAVGISSEEATQALRTVGLQQDADALPQALSGGMRRRLSIARALAYGGDLFFLDEPLRGLDAATAAPVLDALKAALQGKTALLITHRPDEAFALADRLILVDGPPVRVLQTADVNTFEDVEALTLWLQNNSPRYETRTSSKP